MKNLRTKLSYAFYTLLVAFLFTACSSNVESTNNIVDEPKPTSGTKVNGSINVVEVEGCEYIVWDWYDAGNIIHKHNCKFCAERSK
tara:strand:+ start:6055 stop:6312 length:258 start_codon:yes stop_codon:yes gene_type:complete